MAESKSSFNPNSTGLQILIIVMICLLPTGSYFGMDSPAPIESDLKRSLTTLGDPDKDLCPDGFNNSVPEANCSDSMKHGEYMFFWTIYSFPNLVMCFVSGYLIDSVLGRRKASIVYGSIVALGALFVSVGAYYDNLYVIYVGRFIFGIGSESMALCEYAYNIHWFDRTKLDSEPKYKPVIGLSLMFGVAISISRGATAAAFQVVGRAYNSFAGVDQNATDIANAQPNVTEPVTIYNADQEAAGKAFFICFIYALICLGGCAFLGWIDIQGSRWRKQHKLSKEEVKMLAVEEAAENKLEMEASGSPAAEKAAEAAAAEDEDDDDQPKMITFQDVMSIPLTGWLVFVICVTFYATIFPFVSQGVEFLMSYKGMTDKEDARFYTSFILVLSGLGVAPAMGFLIDNFKYNTVWLGSGVSLAGLGHFALTHTDLPVFPVIIGMGLGYASVAASLWPLLAYNVPKRISGTSYGIMQSFQLGGLMLTYQASGLIMDSYGNDKNGGYKMIENIFVLLNCVALFCTVWLAKIKGLNGGA